MMAATEDSGRPLQPARDLHADQRSPAADREASRRVTGGWTSQARHRATSSPAGSSFACLAWCISSPSHPGGAGHGAGRRARTPAGRRIPRAGPVGLRRGAYRLLPTVFWLGAGDRGAPARRLGRRRAGGAAHHRDGTRSVLAAPLGAVPLADGRGPGLPLVPVGRAAPRDRVARDPLGAGRGWAAARPAAAGPVARWLLVLLALQAHVPLGRHQAAERGPDLAQLTALDYHFETQPLPTWTAWYAHHLPGSVHAAARRVMFAIELGAPWLLLAPARLRRLALAGVAGLVRSRSRIAATGNYGFFNLLAIVLCIPVLDDDVASAGVPSHWRRPKVRRSGDRRLAVHRPGLLAARA